MIAPLGSRGDCIQRRASPRSASAVAPRTAWSNAHSRRLVVPAHNEAATVGAVARAIRGSSSCGSLIVIADACHDATGAEARSAGALVIELDARNKGTAMAAGLRYVTTSSVGFIDADLEGLEPEHIDALTRFPGQMAIGLRSASPELIAKTALPPIGGERVLPANVVNDREKSPLSIMEIPHLGVPAWSASWCTFARRACCAVQPAAVSASVSC
ncbi:MAG: glycosyltransferase [Solirubrobacteraceae bacterium]